MSPTESPSLDRRRSWIVLAVAAIAIACTLWFLDRLQPLANWLFWHFAVIYGFVLFFGVACFCAGHALLAWPCRNDRMAPAERWLLDMAAGVLVFAVGTFLVGIAHGLGSLYFWLFPSALILLGLPFVERDGGNVFFDWLRARSRFRQAPSLAVLVATGFGAIGLLLVYLPLLTTENIAFDASWYHLAIAEHYVAAGRIAAFPEGWHLGSIPHLASWLYTWALASPVLGEYGRLQLAAHIEFFLFLLTLAAAPLLVARLTGARQARGTWAVFFLFPGLFLYDSNLSSAADHVLAFWAAPLALSALWFVGTFRSKRAVVLAVACAGAGLTKVHGIYLLVPTALFVLGCGAIRVVRRQASLRRLVFVFAVPLLGSFLLLTASYWLANTIWHHNPFYPLLPDVFPSRPWRIEHPGGMVDPGWRPHGSLAHRLAETLLSPLSFAFVPHDWTTFHRNLPVFGFLFTFSLAMLPFLRRARRLWVLGLGTVLGLLIWYWTYHQDRYLQALLPWMVAVTAAVFVRAWNMGLPARIAVVGLVALQLVWGGDIPFIPGRYSDHTGIEKSIRFLSSTYRNDIENRFDTSSEFKQVGLVLPRDSVVLLHLLQMRLGIGRPVVTDNPRWTSVPFLGSLAGPAAAWQQLRGLGVTHILFKSDRCKPEDMDLQSELATHYLAHFASDRAEEVDGKIVVALSKHAPAPTAFPEVLFSGCSTRGRVAWHTLNATFAADRRSPSEPAPDLPAVGEDLFAGLECAVIDGRCRIDLPEAIASEWRKVTEWKQVQLWMREVSSSQQAPP
ncbi:MAG: hypothetical protein JXP73_15195 [Deltaproteobacteria bacterium]|nr:hypothetical protein [Deltaproteobacteria bacterium]